MPEAEATHSEQPKRLDRRRFLVAAGGALGLAVPGSRALWAIAAAEPKRSRKGEPFHDPLPIPREIRSSEIELAIREAHVQALPGRKTKMWTYGGTFPGPTIRRPAGEPTSVTFHHRLPKHVGELTVHLHGGHNTSADDGQPGGLTATQRQAFYCDVSPDLSARQSGNDLLIKPGKSRAYNYELMEDGAPERAAFQWYHDHRLERTSRNVWHGLAGMWIIDDELDASLPLPAGGRDIPLLIADRSFDSHNQLRNPFANVPNPPGDGIKGSHVLVNGAWRPHHHIHACRYRIRVLNASGFRTYNLFRSDGEPLIQVGSDSGLMPKPVKRRRVLLAPAERAELIVDFSGAAGKRVELRSGPAGAPRIPGARPYHGALMEFRVGRRIPDRTTIPDSLRPLPSWAAAALPVPQRTWTISLSGGFIPRWLINGKPFDPARADAYPLLGTTETWQIVNDSDAAHAIHMHSTDWYLLARNGAPPPPWEDCLKETFLIRPHETLLVAARFSDNTGKFVIHCHMLDHEDHGLMDQFEVVASPADQPADDPVARRRRRRARRA